MARRKKEPTYDPPTPTPPSWRWRIEPQQGASVDVFKDLLRWQIWDDHPRDEGPGGWVEQPILAFLQDGPKAEWFVPDDVITAVRAWCESGAWRALRWTDVLSIRRAGTRGPTFVDGRPVEGDVVDERIAEARATGYTVESDVTTTTHRTVHLVRPWRPPDDESGS